MSQLASNFDYLMACPLSRLKEMAEDEDLIMDEDARVLDYTLSLLVAREIREYCAGMKEEAEAETEPPTESRKEYCLTDNDGTLWYLRLNDSQVNFFKYLHDRTRGVDAMRLIPFEELEFDAP